MTTSCDDAHGPKQDHEIAKTCKNSGLVSSFSRRIDFFYIPIKVLDNVDVLIKLIPKWAVDLP